MNHRAAMIASQLALNRKLIWEAMTAFFDKSKSNSPDPEVRDEAYKTDTVIS